MSPLGPSRVLATREFRLFQRLIHREAGIHLSEAKKVLVEGRLARRLRELCLDFDAYYRLVEVDEGPRLVGYMVNTRPDEMRFGMPVRVVFERLTERVTLPVWEPAR